MGRITSKYTRRRGLEQEEDPLEQWWWWEQPDAEYSLNTEPRIFLRCLHVEWEAKKEDSKIILYSINKMSD